VGRLARVWRGKPNHIICIFDDFLLLIYCCYYYYCGMSFWTEALDGSRHFVFSTWYTCDLIFGVVLTSVDLGTDCETVT
jgi:hypothetical protein